MVTRLYPHYNIALPFALLLDDGLYVLVTLSFISTFNTYTLCCLQ